MGNVLETCPSEGVMLSGLKLNDPNGTCIRKPVYYVAVGKAKGTNSENVNNIAVSTDGNRWIGVGRFIFDFCFGITYNNIQKKWVAVGRGNNSIATSTNGYNWTGLGNTIFSVGTGGADVKYANNLYIAVGGTLNSIATSINGDDWNGLGNTIFSKGNMVKYANALWVAGGTDASGGTNQIATSSNGTIWNRKNIYFDSNGPTGVSYGNGLWITVCGTSNTIAKSTNNGDTWTKTTTSILSGCYDVFYISNLWVIVGTGNNQIATSSDGNVWTGLGNTFFQIQGKTVNYINELWFVGGQNINATNITYNSIFSSSNGNSWKPKADYTILNTCNKIEYATPLLPQFVVIGNTGISIATIFIDGTTWTIEKINRNIVSIIAAAYGKDDSGNGLFVAVGSGGLKANTIISSIDGIIWTDISNTDINNTNYSIFTGAGNGVAFGKDESGTNLWVAVGRGTNSFASSINGTEWTGRGGYGITTVRQSNGTITYIQPIFDVGGNDVVYGNGLWVAVGIGTSHVFASSTNGTQWTGRGGITIFNNGFSLAFGNNLWVAVGKGTFNFATSTNGTVWTGTGNSGVNAIFSECNNVAFGNNLWVAVGQGRNTDSFATSTDGIIWTPRGGKNGVFDWYGKNVKYGKDKLGNGLWIAGGKGTSHVFATSTNGTQWVGKGGKTIFDNECLSIVAL